MSEYPFLPICDKTHFPMLSAGTEQPYATLMCCDELIFCAPENIFSAQEVIKNVGSDWHLYGDTRWPSRSLWIEFPLSHGNFSAHCGVLVLNAKVPLHEPDTFNWMVRNNPLLQVAVPERGEAMIQKRLEMLRMQSVSTEYVAGPEDAVPIFIQNYGIFQFKDQDKPRFVAAYTDLLNATGIPIPKYRTANASGDDILYCRFALHALFGLNGARQSGMTFLEIPQLKKFAPVLLAPNQKNPKWAQFHPSRVLRTRPALRAFPTPADMRDGILLMSDYEKVLEGRRREFNTHTLPFERLSRPREKGMALMQEDVNVSIFAFSHRANGGAIYVLPDRLVEEFDKTDCEEVCVSDITLPFPNIFLKFTPPQPLFLFDDAQVDGCYLGKQGEEYLFQLTSCLGGVDYQKSLSITCIEPTFALHLPIQSEMRINAAVEHGIKDFLAKNAPPEDNQSRTFERPDGTVAQVIDIRAKSRRQRIKMFRSQEPVFRACLNIIVNAACFISFRPDDISDTWEGEPPSDLVESANDAGVSRRGRDRKRNAQQKIERGDYTRIKICGQDLFSDIPKEDAQGHHTSPRAHWRRGHWRRQRHGTGLTLVILRWIRPTIVMKEAGPVVEARIYEVPKSSSDSTSSSVS